MQIYLKSLVFESRVLIRYTQQHFDIFNTEKRTVYLLYI